jgi:UDP-N-acetylmuramoyl-tripeptide--D-alanyl-D-alanine ligase
MEKLLLSEIANAINSQYYKEAEITEICTDTRSLTEGCLFIALKGERFDAHDFVPKAFELGAAACITEKEIENCECMVVDDCRKALKDIAHLYRNKFTPFLVGVTGSVGKTTTKEMISLALSSKYPTLKTQGNLNNEIGLPKTLFNLTSEHKAAVIEMGMSHFGEISRLAKTASPLSAAVITNIGFSHIENLKSQEGILKAKLEILDGIGEDAPLVLNGDDAYLWGAKDKLDNKVYTYAIDNKDADFRAENIIEYNGMTEFTAIYEGKEFPVCVTAVGRHNVLNVLAAICVGRIAGIEDELIIPAFTKYSADALRQNISEKNGQIVITDCYNASPDSMKASLSVLKGMECKGRKIAVLGDMLEMGEMSEMLHRMVGNMVSAVKPDMVFCYGKDSEYIYKTVSENGIDGFYSSDKNEVADALSQYVREGDIVLFKASRGMRLEEIITKVYGEVN